MDIPFESIRQTLDRSWSERLVDLIETASEDDLAADEAMTTLADLGDPAVTDRLFAIATNRDRSDFVRLRAIDIIDDTGLTLEGNDLRQWWLAGDDIMKMTALEQAYRTELDYLRPVVEDPLHPLHRHAIMALKIGFDDAEWQGHITSALSHFDPAIQELGANLAIWEEPVAAQPRLIELANTAPTEIAVTAVKTLNYYRSRTSLRALAELVHHEDSERADEARDAVEDLATEFHSMIDVDNPDERAYMEAWARPIADVIALHHFERPDYVDSFESELPPELPLHGPELARALSDTTGEWAEKMTWLRAADWTEETDADRKVLRGVLLEHVDPMVRQHAARILAQWNDVDGLLQLSTDSLEMIRKPAVYWLGELPQDPRIADAVWPLIGDDLAGGWAAREALTTWIKHTSGDPTDRLVHLVLHDTRENVRWTALNELGSEHAGRVQEVLDGPPAISWAMHSLLLGYSADAKITPQSLNRLREVDDLYVASECAKFNVNRGAT